MSHFTLVEMSVKTMCAFAILLFYLFLPKNCMKCYTFYVYFQVEKKKKSFVRTIAFCFVCSFVLFGCSKKVPFSPHRTSDEKVIVRISMYNSSSFPAWRAYIEKSCPDFFIKWEDNRNSCANVIYTAQNDDMPDIVTIRRFETDSAAKLEPYLSDLSGLALASTFESQYLDAYIFNSKLCWFPEPALVEGIYANTVIFNRYGIPLPKDLNSFIRACRQFEKHSYTVCGFDCKEGWSCASLIQGFGAAADRSSPILASAPVLRILNRSTILTEEDMNMTAYTLSATVTEGLTAMYRCSSDEAYNRTEKSNYVVLPYFGKTESDSVLYMYPVFCAALSKKTESDAALRNACLKVLAVMFDKTAQSIIGEQSDGLVSFNKNVHLDLSPAMDYVKPLIEQKKFYMRQLNANSFDASRAAIESIIFGGADDSTFMQVYEKKINELSDTDVVGITNVNADNKLDSALNSPAAGIIADVVREQTNSSCAIIDSREAAAPLYAGPFTKTDIHAVVLNGPLYGAVLDASDLDELLKTIILYTTTFLSGGTEPVVDYPALSGIDVTMRKDGSFLSSQAPGTYKVAISSRIFNALCSAGSAYAERFVKTPQTLANCLEKSLLSGEKLPPAHIYFTVKE